MSNVVVGLIGLCVFLILLFLGMPVSISMMICGVGGLYFLMREPSGAFTTLTANVFSTLSSYTNSVAPAFILMGELASVAGLGKDLFTTIQKLSGGRRGVLASAAQIVCAIFGAVCGVTTATAGMMCRVAYPEMRRHNYRADISAGCIAAGASLATLIPPSLSLITYGIAAEASIGKLFIGGIGTGILLMLCLIAVVQIWCVIDPNVAPAASERYTFKEKIKALFTGSLLQIIIVFALAIGGMFAGWFTPTESGAVGVVGIIIVTLISRSLTIKKLIEAIKNTLVMSGFLYIILAGASVFGTFFAYSRIPTVIGELIASMHIPNVLVVMFLTIVYLILGCFIDALPLMLLTIPVFLPIVQSCGYDIIWFGCYVVVIMGLGCITPPVGIACYVVSGMIDDISLTTVFKGSLPFVFGYVVCAFLMAFFPQVVTWLPGLLYG